MTLTHYTKPALRLWAKAKRSSILTSSCQQELVRQVSSGALFRQASVVALYYPLANEVNLLPLRDQASRHWLLPRMTNKTSVLPSAPSLLKPLPMAFHTWQDRDSLLQNRLGIMEPPETAPIFPASEADREQTILMLVPALLVDTSGTRLGYGKGMYDQWLFAYKEWANSNSKLQKSGANHPNKDSFFKVYSVIPKALVFQSPLPKEAWDMPLDGWIDEEGWHEVVRHPGQAR